MTTEEHIIKAEQGMGFVCDDLQQLSGESNPLIELHARQLAVVANQLRDQLSAFRQAMEATG